MAKGLNIIKNQIEFNSWSISEIDYPCNTKSFNINFDEIKIVAVSPRLSLDDEILMVTLINEQGEFYQFSNFEFGGDSIRKFENKLNLKSIRTIEWAKFSWEDHESASVDKIIYPYELYWEDLFFKNGMVKKMIVRVLRFFRFKKSVSGRFNPKVASLIKIKTS